MGPAPLPRAVKGSQVTEGMGRTPNGSSDPYSSPARTGSFFEGPFRKRWRCRGLLQRYGILKGEFVMGKWLQPVLQFLRREDGPTAVEYAVMLALIVVVCIASITTLGSSANKTFTNVALNTAVSGS
jgi:pilus assembly protein Flp/PilA